MQLTQNSHAEFGCTCSWLIGYGVDDRNLNEWAEKMISRDSECILHGDFVTNGRKRINEVESRAV